MFPCSVVSDARVNEFELHSWSTIPCRWPHIPTATSHTISKRPFLVALFAVLNINIAVTLSPSLLQQDSGVFRQARNPSRGSFLTLRYLKERKIIAVARTLPCFRQSVGARLDFDHRN